jgi:hypothetical protein
MAKSAWTWRVAALVAALLTGGCALTVPKVQKLGEASPTGEWLREANLVTHVKCEIHNAVSQVIEDDRLNRLRIDQMNTGKPDREKTPQALPIDWLKTWGVKVTLKLIVDEKAGVAPGFTFNNPMRNVIRMFPSGGNVTAQQAQNTALAAALSSGATRTETVGFFYGFDDLLKQKPNTMDCAPAHGLMMDGDLRVLDFMRAKMLAAQVPGVMGRKYGQSPFDTLSYQVAFVVTATASATPSWKLVYLSANPTAPFLNGSRARTNDMTLTMGPATAGGYGTVEPNQAVRDAHLAATIGESVASAIRSLQP